MKEIDNERNGVIQTQKSLYLKLKKINNLFKIHFFSLILFFSFTLLYAALLTYLLAIGQVITDLSQRYDLFGVVITIFLIIILYIFIVQIGIQIIFYGLFIIRGNHSLKQIKGDHETKTPLYGGIVPYIINFYTFFKRYSKEKTTLVKLVKRFLFLNFLSGFYVIFISSRFMKVEGQNIIISLSIVIVLLVMLAFWLMNVMATFKISKQIKKWETLFPKLEEWARNIEQFSSENSILFDDEESP